jgi:hypothetical protein
MSKKKHNNNQITNIEKPPSIEEMKKIVAGGCHMNCDPDILFKELSSSFIKIKEGGNKAISAKDNELLLKATYFDALNNYSMLVETINQNYRPFLINFARELTNEYNCISSSEKAMVQTIVASYGRIMSISNRLNNCSNFDYLSSDRNGYFSILSKELDRAHRQFIMALQTLKLLKSPPLQVNVKTNTAFIANNQQMVNTQEVKHENNNS